MAVIVIVHISHFRLLIGLYCCPGCWKYCVRGHCQNILALDDTGWHQMSLDGTRWHQMALDVTRCHQMSLDVTRCHQMSLDVTRCHQMSLDVARWHQMALDATRCHQMPQDGTVKMFEKAFRSRFASFVKIYYKTFTVIVKALHAASSQCVPLSSLSCKYQTSVKLKHRESTQAYFVKAQCYSRECRCAR